METNYMIMVIAAMAAFVWSSLYYMLLSKLMSSPEMNTARPPAWKLGAEIVRNGLFVFIMAHVFANLGVTQLSQGLRHSFWLWLAFPVTLFAGTALWENMPWKTALSHTVDWLVKMVLIAGLLITFG